MVGQDADRGQGANPQGGRVQAGAIADDIGDLAAGQQRHAPDPSKKVIAAGPSLTTVVDGVHYPGTYLAGVYNRTISRIDDRTLETEHLVNAPDWTYLAVRAA
ncbi:hypothetical protein, partial [Nocardia neocaledoniensis]|uniref:hypothetical protein n=1 Tax=Nocardia neocaledoniensis TaxID=236511 RepID=UPI002454B36C